MPNHIDTNAVELTGIVVPDPVLRLVPPGATFYVAFELCLCGEWPDYTGTAVLLEYKFHCFAQGPLAEAITWVAAGDRVHLRGHLDLMLYDYEPTTMMAPIYKPAIRVREMRLIEEGESQ